MNYMTYEDWCSPSPSVQDGMLLYILGMSEDDEMQCIYEIMNFLRYIYESFHNYPDIVFYKALVLLHKFFRKVSIRQLRYDKCLVGTACFFLAAKLEDCPVKLIDLAVLYHKAELKRNGWPMKSPTEQQKFQIQSKICELESEILRQIGFDLEIELPYRYFKQFKDYPAPNMEKILKTAACFCNDTFLKPLCLYYHPMQIACSCIYFASLFFKTPLPDNKNNPWFKYLHEGIELRHLQDVTEVMKTIYKKMEERKKQSAGRAAPNVVAKTENSNAKTTVKTTTESSKSTLNCNL